MCSFSLFSDDMDRFNVCILHPPIQSARQTVYGRPVNHDQELQNGSDHAVVASYSGLYEECDVEHINVFGLVS